MIGMTPDRPSLHDQLILETVKQLYLESVVDVSGNGSALSLLHHELAIDQTAGIDVSEEALAFCRQRLPGTFLTADITREAVLPGRRFDLVL